MTNTSRRPATALLLVFVTAPDAAGRGGSGALAFDVLEIQSDARHVADPPGDVFIDPLISSRNTGPVRCSESVRGRLCLGFWGIG